MRHRLVQPAGVLEYVAEIVVGVNEVTLQFEGAAMTFLGFLELAALPERQAEVVVSLGEMRFQLDRAVVARDRIIVPPLLSQGVTELVMSLGQGGACCHGASKQSTAARG